MKKITIIGILVFTGIFLYGQSQPISIKKVGKKGEVYEQNGKRLKIRQLLVITESNPAAYKEIKIAKSNSSVASVFLAGSLFLSLSSLTNTILGNYFLDSKQSLILLGVDVVLLGIAIPIISSSSKHTKKGVVIYNNGFKPSILNNADIKIGVTNNGIGMKIRF
jgi:hypothetical protein